MFTGLIEATGVVERVATRDSGSVLTIGVPAEIVLALGDSIAVNGVCLTVATFEDGRFTVDVSPETLRVTTVGAFASGRAVNLERPLRADARLGGHFVLGHVDGVGRIRGLRKDGASYWLDIEAPAAVARYLIEKGSIAVDGISLTIARLDGQVFGVQIVPYTWQHTAVAFAKPGDPVNLEADVLGKYVARLLQGQAAGEAGTGTP
ncbi:MAG TPA: riboflavin synthase [Vicinamibacterales bacterium]|nr:riboflavin synthase [Vicinamibacterales bacterium]